MTLNFFTLEQGFQKPSTDPSSQIGTKKEYTTSLKRDEFKTSNAAQHKTRQDLTKSEQNDKFAEMMNALKKKESSNKKSSVKTQPSEIIDSPKNIRASLITADAFKTEKSAPPAQTKGAALQAQLNSALPARLHSALQAQLNSEPPGDDLPAQLGSASQYPLSSELAAQLNNIEPGSDTQDNLIKLENIAALSAEIQKLIEQQPENSDTENQILVTVESKAEEVENIISLLASFLDNKDENEDTPAGSAFSSILEKIQDTAKSSDALAITSSLTPQQITQLQDQIQKYLSDELSQRDQDTLEALAAQFVSLAPPTEKVEKDAIHSTLQTIPEAANVLAAPATKEENRTQSIYDARYSGAEESLGSESERTEKSDFKSVLKDLGSKADAHDTGAANNNGKSQSAGQSFLQMTNLSQGAAGTFDSIMQQGSSITGIQTSSPLQNSSLTNIITQSQSAGANHPATQMVSATIQKAVKAGEDTNIKLKLDPPELGRVEVKMSIDKDNATKIVLTAEKPETFMMLKQDSEALERALQNAGLETEGSLSFELASEDHDFGHNNKQGTDQDQTSNRAKSDAEDETLIETTMDWHVDSKTGRMHYSALV